MGLWLSACFAAVPSPIDNLSAPGRPPLNANHATSKDSLASENLGLSKAANWLSIKTKQSRVEQSKAGVQTYQRKRL